MAQRCEVCESFRPQGDLNPERKLVEITFGTRRVLLCAGHAQIAQNSGVTSFDELRDLYRESSGARSFVSRRARAASEQASERRHPGRRAADV